MARELVIVKAPTVTVTNLVSALADLTVKVTWPLPSVTPDAAGETVLSEPLTDQFTPKPTMGLLLESLMVAVTVAVEELSAGKLLGDAVTDELATLTSAVTT